MTTIIRGANLLLTRPLLQSDGVTPLDVGSIVTCECKLRQHGVTKKTLTYGIDPELRYGDDNQSIILELTTAITETDLAEGEMTEIYTITITEAAFQAEPDTLGVYKLKLTEVTLE